MPREKSSSEKSYCNQLYRPEWEKESCLLCYKDLLAAKSELQVDVNPRLSILYSGAGKAYLEKYKGEK